jgi:hypothetical protein
MTLAAERPLNRTAEDGIDAVARRVSLTVLWVLAGPIVLWLTIRAQYTGLVHADAMEYAQIARNVAAGHGFTTDVLRPLALAVHPGSVATGGALGGAPAHSASPPDLTHPPLYSFLLALLFGALGAGDGTVVLLSALCYLLLIPVVYALASRWFNRTVAVVSALVIICWRQTVGYAITGLPVLLVMLLVTLLLLLLHRAAGDGETGRRGDGAMGRLALAGAVLGLCYLTEYSSVLFLLPIVVYLGLAARASGGLRDHGDASGALPGRPAQEGQRMLAGGEAPGLPKTPGLPNTRGLQIPASALTRVAVFLAAFLVIAGPWMLRNARLGVHPVFGLRSYELVMGTNVHPGYSLYRAADLSEAAPMTISMVAQIVRKGVVAAGSLYDQLPQIPGIWLTPFIVLSLFYRFRRPGVEPLRWCALGMLATLAAASIFYRATFEIEQYVPFVPFLTVIGVAALVRLASERDLPPLATRALLATLVLVTAFPLAVSLKFGAAAVSGIDTAGLAQISMPREAVLASDVPWAVAWYGNRRSMWLPQTEKDLERLAPQIEGIYLTSLILAYPAGEDVDRWKAFYSTSWTHVGIDAERRPVLDPAPVYFGVHGIPGQSAGKPGFEVRQFWPGHAILLVKQ